MLGRLVDIVNKETGDKAIFLGCSGSPFLICAESSKYTQTLYDSSRRETEIRFLDNNEHKNPE